MRRNKVVLSKVRGDINPADVLTKPKSLEDMKQLLNFSCFDWCDGKVVNDTCSSNRIEFINNVDRSIFVNRRMVHPRGGVGIQTVCFGPKPRDPQFGKGQRRNSRKHVETGRVWSVRQAHECAFGSRH